MVVSILGCGWLGGPLAGVLASQDYEVKASRTSKDSWQETDFQFIRKYILNVSSQGLNIDNEDFFEADFLIISIPPKRKSLEANAYAQKLWHICEYVKPNTHVVFISSTSTYEANMDWVKEDVVINNDHHIRKAELVLEENVKRYTILRMAGLIGYNRGRLQANKINTKRSLKTPMNLVHLDDCLAAISSVLDQAATNDIYNICADEHPDRLQYYQQFFSEQELKRMFVEAADEPFKLVSNEKFKKTFDFEYRYPAPSKVF